MTPVDYLQGSINSRLLSVSCAFIIIPCPVAISAGAFIAMGRAMRGFLPSIHRRLTFGAYRAGVDHGSSTARWRAARSGLD